MRFLVSAITRQAIPPDVALPLAHATKAWVEQYTVSGKMKDAWGFAGLQGGGGILDVQSHEELNEIISEYPFSVFAEIEVLPLSDIHVHLENVIRLVEQMASQQAR